MMGNTPMRKLTLLTTALVALALATACGNKEEAPAAGPPKRPPAPVVTAKAKKTDFPVELSQMGTVEADQTTPVKAQVGGQLVSVSIKEGQAVSAGQELFRIDSRTIEGNIRQLEADRERFTAQLKTAEAQLLANEAQAKTAAAQAAAAEATVKTVEAQGALADSQAKRYQGLVEKDFVTREQADQMRTAALAANTNLSASRSQAQASQAAAEAAKANVEATRASFESIKASRAATEAAIENAKVQLGYTIIRAPIGGQTGSLMVNLGDYVKGNGDATLVVINQINPILVKFSLPEAMLPEVMRYKAEGTLKVSVDVPGGDVRQGTLTFVDNMVDRSTGTIALKAAFANADGKLWPGQFVGVKLNLYTREGAVAVPSSAIQVGQRGPYAYVVGEDQTAQLRLVRPGLSRGGLTIVEDGVKDGETVVIDGHLKVAPGAPVVEKPAVGSHAAKAAAAGGKPEGAGK